MARKSGDDYSFLDGLSAVICSWHAKQRTVMSAPCRYPFFGLCAEIENASSVSSLASTESPQS
jgi:hypothetical protein